MEDLNLLLSEKKIELQKIKKKQSLLGWFRVAVFLALTYFLLQYYIFVFRSWFFPC
jgi:hypothetical protein